MMLSPTSRNLRAALLLAGIATLFGCSQQQTQTAAAPEEGSLLAGRVTDSSGQGLIGVPVRAHKIGSNITVSVYTDANGDYSFPAWSDVTAGTYRVLVNLPDYTVTSREQVEVAAGSVARVDLQLDPRTPLYIDASASEIAAALPGTDEEKVLFTQCSNCHSMQLGLREGHTKAEWAAIIERMAGTNNTSRDFPGSKTYGQKRFLEPLSAYLEKVRGPESSPEVPFKLRPRPTDPESLRLVVTEYDLPRGGTWGLYILRGDPRYVWPHDVVVDQNYAWYTDHFSSVLGRLDKRTGEAVEISYPMPPGGGRDPNIPAGTDRAGNPGGGSHDILFDSKGNLIIGMDDATVRYDPMKNEFVHWLSGNNMFGIDRNDHVWNTDDGGPLFEINTATGQITQHDIPTNDGVYDMDTDSKGRTLVNIWRNAEIGVFDQATKTYKTYPLLTPESGPRRGEIDRNDNLWVTLYYAGRLARFNADTEEVKEYPLIPGTEAYQAPYTAPYSATVDNGNQLVWTTDFNSNRLFRFDIATEKFTEYLLPGPYEMRDVTVEEGTERPTLWIPSYRPQSQIVKIQIR
jgi:virginiamycin B lyase